MIHAQNQRDNESLGRKIIPNAMDKHHHSSVFSAVNVIVVSPVQKHQTIDADGYVPREDKEARHHQESKRRTPA